MLLSLRQLPAECKAPEALSVHLLQQIYPRVLLETVLSTCQKRERRLRRLSLLVVLMLVIVMNWYPRRSQRHVLETLARGTRELWPADTFPFAAASSLAQRRAQLGSEPLHLLFRTACRPLATPQTKGAFRLGYRVMAIDGTWQNVAETAANAEAFGRFQRGKYQSPFPQVRCVLLVECGTHAIVDADVANCRVAERDGAFALLRSLTPEMLLTLDTGLYGAPFWQAVTQKGAAVLGRVPSHALKRGERHLSDGTTLTTMRCRQAGRTISVPVRLICYQITDPRVGNPETLYRLATTLLDPATAPAEELITLYHERWEAELVVDELKNHQHLSLRPLRSLTPDGVLQELYGWLLAHYALRVLLVRSAQQVGLDPDRLSFTRALQLVDEASFSFALLAPSEHPRLLQRLLSDLCAHPLPARRFRLNARVIKQRFSKFARKQQAHRQSPHLQGFSFLDVVRLL